MKPGTAVLEGGKAGRQRKERRRRKEGIKEGRKCGEEETDRELDRGKRGGKGREKGLAAMGSDSEVDKERNMDSHRREEKDRQGWEREKGEEGCVGKGR